MNDYKSHKLYVLPEKNFLKSEKENASISEEEQQEMEEICQKIVNTFASFNIRVIPEEILRGPTVTRYELLYPAQKKSIRTLTQYRQDIALATQSKYVNFLLPIPGKNAIGIEIVNRKRKYIPLGEIVNVAEFFSPSIHIPIPMGKDMQGYPIIEDLTTMPHLLAAGNACSGISGFIDSILASLLLKFHPDELQLILVDTYCTRLQLFAKLPHLIFPPITNTHTKPETMLDWCIKEIEHRHQCFVKTGTYDIEAFNKREKTLSTPTSQGNIPQYFPYIIIIIDDLADLMEKKETIKHHIAELTRTGHTAGIHLILATRNPSTEILIPSIKAFIHARVAFHVNSPTASHLILERGGAENLWGEGDMLYRKTPFSQEKRIQSAFISEDEVQMLTNHCSRQITPAPIPCTRKKEEENDTSSSEDEECYLKSLKVVLAEKKASTSLLQRRLLIGYARAAKMMDLLEIRGVIAPADNSNRPRRVLIQ